MKKEKPLAKFVEYSIPRICAVVIYIYIMYVGLYVLLIKAKIYRKKRISKLWNALLCTLYLYFVFSLYAAVLYNTILSKTFHFFSSIHYYFTRANEKNIFLLLRLRIFGVRLKLKFFSFHIFFSKRRQQLFFLKKSFFCYSVT